MQQRQSTQLMSRSKKFFGVVALVVCVLDLAQPVRAAETSKELCGLIEGFSGDLVILTYDKTEIIEPARKKPLECGSWISVNSGTLKFKHRDGHKVLVGPYSYLALGNDQTAELALFRGRVHAEANFGGKAFRIMTANALGTVKDSTAMVVFNEQSEESQLVGLERKSTFQNRFVADKKIVVKAGEMSTLNFSLMRVIPTAAKAISSASMRGLMEGMGFEARDLEYAKSSVEKRQGRSLASFPVLPSDAEVAMSDEYKEQALAEQQRKQAEYSSYMRHKPSAVDQALHQHWAGKISGGSPLGSGITAKKPGQGGRWSKNVRVRVEDRSIASSKKKTAAELEADEKRELIDELKKIEQ